jgi:hypothetical protein
MNHDATDVEIQIQAHLDQNGQLSCKAAHLIANDLDVEPLHVGDQASAKGVRIIHCQLGFFGYAEKKGMPGYKIVHKLDSVPEAVATAVRQATKNGQISCAVIWEIGQAQGISKLDMGNIVETLGIKVRPCQLGCF